MFRTPESTHPTLPQKEHFLHHCCIFSEVCCPKPAMSLLFSEPRNSRQGTGATHRGALTSAPRSSSMLTICSEPPLQAACSGRRP